MSVAREIAKAQEKQSCEHLRDPRVAEDFCFVAGQPRNKFFGRRQDIASIGGGRSESRRYPPLSANVAWQGDAAFSLFLDLFLKAKCRRLRRSSLHRPGQDFQRVCASLHPRVASLWNKGQRPRITRPGRHKRRSSI